MKKAIIFFSFCVFLQVGLDAPLNAQSSSPRKRISFDADWKFHPGHAADPSRDFNFKIAAIFSKTGKSEGTAISPSFNDSAWRTIQLPHDWAVELPFVESPNFDVMAHGYKPVGGLFPENSVGWYRKTFFVARSDSGYRFAIQFDGMFRDGIVWVNGHYVGNNKSGYMGITYDVTDFLNFDKPNVLVVRIDATQYEGWFYEGAGIYRHVWLHRYDNLHIAENGVFVHADVRQDSAMVSIETIVTNQGLELKNCSVQSSIMDRGGVPLVQSKEQSLERLFTNEKRTVKAELVLENPRLWSLEDPYLYRAVVTIRLGGRVIDKVTTRFGIRTILFDAEKGLLLNKQNIKIQGVCCHQDHAGVGSALPDYLQYYRIGLLKELGVNAYRTSHNAPTPELLEACDSLGMLVLDETRLLNSSSEYMHQFERLILRDRNHPSVILWSIGNEEGYVQTTGIGKRIALSMLAKQRELDPTRTSTYAADVANVFSGINEVIPVRGFNYRVSGIIPYHNDHPRQPILGTEMGSTVTTRGIYAKDTVKGYVPDQDLTAPWWATRAEDWWPLAAENPWMSGGFVWTGFDYRGEPTPYQWPNINSHFGIMDVCGFPKNIYYYYQSWWTDKDVLHISPHWNWKGSEGKPTKVWVNTNADSVELMLNGKSLGMKTVPRNRHVEWDVSYEPGRLEARAFKKGKQLVEKVETTGEPRKLILSPSKKTLRGDGRDAAVVNVEAVDDKGRKVPDAQNLVQFMLTGDARIIGVGNGDPSSHEPDKGSGDSWQRRLFNGKCQLILQSGSRGGPISLEASSAGLESASIRIEVVPSAIKDQTSD